MKRFFHSELESFRSRIILMGERSIDSVRLALRALERGDDDLARQVRAGDDAIDQLENEIDAEAIRYLSLRAPVAGELRLLTVGMKIGHDLERVGDESTNIAKRVQLLTLREQPPEMLHIPKMGQIGLRMLREAVDSFLDGDEMRALTLLARDKEVDHLNRLNYSHFADAIAQEPAQAERFIELIFVSKSLERIADHAANIAEETLYLLRGAEVRHTDEVKRLKK